MDIKDRLLEFLKTKYSQNSEISSIGVQLDAAFIIVNNKMTLNSYTTANITFSKNGKQKKSTMNVQHSFCPFCGQKIEKEVSNE